MAALDAFASTLLEEAKRYLEKASESADQPTKDAYLHSALLLGFAAFEAHVNAIADDFLSNDDLHPCERGLLAEQSVELSDGKFEVNKKTLKMQRLEDRIQFLCRRFSKKPIDRKEPYWSQFVEALRLRNSLTHPKEALPTVSEAAVRRGLTALIELLNVMYMSLYRKGLPAYKRGTSSRLNF
jgi:hypothetical protein